MEIVFTKPINRIAAAINFPAVNFCFVWLVAVIRKNESAEKMKAIAVIGFICIMPGNGDLRTVMLNSQPAMTSTAIKKTTTVSHFDHLTSSDWNLISGVRSIYFLQG